MKIIPLTKGKYTLVDDEDYEWLNQWKWFTKTSGRNFYAARWGENRKQLYMHREIIGAKDNEHIDHINHNGLDNQRSNLRICDPQLNIANCRHQNKCSSTYRGVYWQKQDKRWQSRIKLEQKDIYLGNYLSEKMAAIAYNIAALIHFGEFANINRF